MCRKKKIVTDSVDDKKTAANEGENGKSLDTNKDVLSTNVRQAGNTTSGIPKSDEILENAVQDTTDKPSTTIQDKDKAIVEEVQEDKTLFSMFYL